MTAQEYPNILVTAGLNGRWPPLDSLQVAISHGWLVVYLCDCLARYLTRLVGDDEPDPRVMYSEPAKYVAKLRELKRDDNLLLFKCELGAGHFSKSGR